MKITLLVIVALGLGACNSFGGLTSQQGANLACDAAVGLATAGKMNSMQVASACGISQDVAANLIKH